MVHHHFEHVEALHPRNYFLFSIDISCYPFDRVKFDYDRPSDPEAWHKIPIDTMIFRTEYYDFPIRLV